MPTYKIKCQRCDNFISEGEDFAFLDLPSGATLSVCLECYGDGEEWKNDYAALACIGPLVRPIPGYRRSKKDIRGQERLFA